MHNPGSWGMVVAGLLWVAVPFAEAQSVSQQVQVLIIVPERHPQATQPNQQAEPSTEQLAESMRQLPGVQATLLRHGNTVTTLYTQIAQ